MSWVAFDRAIRLAAEHGRPAPLERWTQAPGRDLPADHEKGWNADRGAFVQHYGSPVLTRRCCGCPGSA
jgi:GH15 family glucan-1,4-alpha-glucosidase